jgi:cytochrome c peroxidase
MNKKFLSVILVLMLLLALTTTALGAMQEPAEPTPDELAPVGEQLYFDSTLSAPPQMSCATCHDPEAGFTGPVSEINASTAVYPGTIEHRFGNRKPPSAAYAGDSPNLYYDEGDDVWVGGMFWDGRASGWTLGDPLAEQAMGPFLNPVEQNLPTAQVLCNLVRSADYGDEFMSLWGYSFINCGRQAGTIHEKIGLTIAAFERSAEFNRFNSKFDLFWDNANAAGLDVSLISEANWEDYSDLGLSDDELNGLVVFNGKAMCSACHVFDEGEAGYPLFTDFTYDNLGVPRNPQNPFYDMPKWINPQGADWVDYGLGAFLKGAGYSEDVYEGQMGKVKVPTLRNVDLRPYDDFVKAFSHNGYFKSLEEIVHFYNTRDVLPNCTDVANPLEGENCWPAPEVAENVNTDELGDLGLTLAEEQALVLFMTTLSDGYTP